MKKHSLSVLIPVFNEEDNINPLHIELKAALERLEELESFEIIFIDDGSTDSTKEKVKSIKDASVSLISLRRNFGKSLALQAGFDLAEGDYVITLDGDLQDDPAEIGQFINQLNQGYDLVIGWKYKRKDSWTKKLPSRLANFIVSSFVPGLKVRDMNSGFKGYKKEVVKKLKLYGEMHRYIPVYVHALGFNIAEIKVNHRKRLSGYSKFGASRLLKGFFDFITALFVTGYISRPLHFFGMIGLVFSFFGFIIGIYLSYLRFAGERIGDRPLLFLSVLLIVIGVQFFAIGLIGEMVNHKKVSDKKLYLIKEDD